MKIIDKVTIAEDFITGRPMFALKNGTKIGEFQDTRELTDNEIMIIAYKACEFLNSIKLTEDGDYYIKVRDSYLTPETQLINVDSERTVYLKDIDNALK
jgi:hypothetical protein